MVLALLVGAGVFLDTEKEIALNDEDPCPNIGARAVIAVLLDTTDELAPVTKLEVKDSILKMQQELPDFIGLLSTPLMKQACQSNLLQACNPGSLDQMDYLAKQGLTANPALLIEKINEFEQTISFFRFLCFSATICG